MARHSFSFDLILVGLPGRFKRWLRLTRQQLARSAEISLARDIHGKSYSNVRLAIELPDPK